MSSLGSLWEGHVLMLSKCVKLVFYTLGVYALLTYDSIVACGRGKGALANLPPFPWYPVLGEALCAQLCAIC